MKAIRWATLISTFPLAGCFTLAPTDTINNATKAFGDVVATSTQLLAAEQKAKPNVRRAEAMMYWLRNGNSSDNLDNATLGASFSRYTCAGVASLVKPKAFLEYATSYSAALQGITAPGGDSFSSQWKKFLENHKEAQLKDPNAAPTPKLVYDNCVTEVEQLIAFSGVPAIDTTDEALTALAALEAYKALFSALEKAATDTLKVANEIQAKKKFSDFVIDQHEKFNVALSQSLGTGSLDKAWERRRAVSLWRPYNTFVEMMRLDRATQSREILALASRLQNELSDFDVLRTLPSPSDAPKALALAESALYALATNKDISVQSVISFLQHLQSVLAIFRKDLEDVKTKFDVVISK